MRQRHQPIRTCVACRATDEKQDLLRVVRHPDRTVSFDPKGKLSGRGAYICADMTCIALARKQKKLERSLKVEMLSDALFSELSARAAAKEVGSKPAATEHGVTGHALPTAGKEREAENV